MANEKKFVQNGMLLSNVYVLQELLQKNVKYYESGLITAKELHAEVLNLTHEWLSYQPEST